MWKYYEEFRERIGEINAKYGEPKIEMSGAVRWSLILLRTYLLFLVLVLGYKFIITIAG